MNWEGNAKASLKLRILAMLACYCQFRMGGLKGKQTYKLLCSLVGCVAPLKLVYAHLG